MATQLKKTVKPSGQGGDYTSLEACINANEQDLAATNRYFDVEIDGNWSSADTTPVWIDNYETDYVSPTEHYINIYTTATARHSGVWNTSKYRLSITTTDAAMYFWDVNIIINGLQMERSSVDSDAILYSGYHWNLSLFNNIIRNITPSYLVIGGSWYPEIAYLDDVKNLWMWNNIFYYSYPILNNTNPQSDICAIASMESTTCTWYIYNNTFATLIPYYSESNPDTYNQWQLDIYATTNSTVDLYVKNNIFYATPNILNELYCTYAASGATINTYSSNNISSDDTSPDGPSYQNKTPSFVSTYEDAEDFHLASSDTTATRLGVDLSGTFTTDIDGMWRGSTWSIGADQRASFVVAPSSGDYTSLEACMNAQESDIRAKGFMNVEISGSWSSSDTTSVTVHNYTTDETRYVNIYTAGSARHQGVFSTSRYYLERTDTSGNLFIVTGDYYVIVDGLQFYYHPASNSSGRIIYNGWKITNNIVRGNQYILGGIFHEGGSTLFDLCANNIVYNITRSTVTGIADYSTDNVTIANNTVFNCYVGITVSNTSAILYNNIGYGSTSSDYVLVGAVSATSSNNLSEDNTAPAYNTYYRNKTLTFTNTTADSEDFHILSTDTNARGKGVDLSGTFTTDIDGMIRIGSWDIGADQYQDAIYTRQDVTPMPSNDNNLSTAFSAQEYVDVEDVNNVYVDQQSSSQYAAFLWKDQGAYANFTVTWVGQSTRATTESPVYLQAYNKNSTTWDSLDSNSAISSGNADFTLTATVTSGLSNYIDSSGWISCRTYQQAI